MIAPFSSDIVFLLSPVVFTTNMSGEKETPPVVDIEDNTPDKYIDPKLQKHAHDADEAMKAIGELHGETITIDEETNKRLLRRIDWHIMPIMCFVYGMNYLDSMVYYNYSDGFSANRRRNHFILRKCYGIENRSQSRR